MGNGSSQLTFFRATALHSDASCSPPDYAPAALNLVSITRVSARLKSGEPAQIDFFANGTKLFSLAQTSDAPLSFASTVGATGAGPLMIVFSPGAWMDRHGYLDLSYVDANSGAQQVKIYVPAFDTTATGNQLALYVAQDGSTLFADAGQAGLSDLSAALPVDQAMVLSQLAHPSDVTMPNGDVADVVTAPTVWKPATPAPKSKGTGGQASTHVRAGSARSAAAAGSAGSSSWSDPSGPYPTQDACEGNGV